MPSFRSILTFAAAALVGFTAAAPATANHEVIAVPETSSVIRRCASGCTSVPDLFVDLKVDIDVLTNKCHDIKPVNGAVDIDAYLGVLAEVKAKVDVAVTTLKTFVGVKADVLLLHDGKLLDINASAKIVVDAIIAISAILKVVVTTCAKVDVVLKVIAEINVLVAALLTSVFACLDVSIKATVCALLKVSVDVLVQVKLLDVVAIIKANVNIAL